MNGRMARVGIVCAAGLLLAVAGSLQAQEKELRDRTVAMLMHYAWQLTPQKFVTPEGKTIIVDKAKRASVVVPTENARDIIRVARMTAHAQICGLEQEQLANFQTLMRREQAKAKWSDQQMLYINQLHLFTVMTLTGQVKADDGDKEFPVLKGELERTAPCTDTERKNIQQQIMAYVNAPPPPPPGPKSQKK